MNLPADLLLLAAGATDFHCTSGLSSEHDLSDSRDTLSRIMPEVTGADG
ncbi:hypothetical protein [Bradyrhizobium diazoefficiens]|nr:hypothetical protein [Bradyrhizobium diazoefficiens]